jgi:DNA-binding XRE family transcriptional regulator
VTVCHVLCDKQSVDTSTIERQTVCMNSEQKFIGKVGKRVASVRKEVGISQEQLAEMVELHRTYIGYIEQGKRNPSIGNMFKIAKALKVDIKEFF